MKRWGIRTFVIMVAAVLFAASTPRAQTAYDWFQQGLVKERAESRLLEAVDLYQAAIKEAGADRALAARALVQLAGCYRKLGNVGEARRTYDRVLAEFANQAGPAAEAKAGLAALVAHSAGPAGRGAKPESVSRRRDVPNGAIPSPDGVYLAVLSDDDLSVRHVETGVVRRLTRQTTSESPCHFVWSPDSRQLAYQWCYEGTPGQKALTEVRVIGVDGAGERVVLPKTEDDVWPRDWSPDGRSIAVSIQKASDDTLHLGIVSVADGSLRELKNFGTLHAEHARFSPDSRYLVYNRPKNPEDPAVRDIVALPVNGGDEQVLVQQASDSQFLGWTPGGGLLFLSERLGTLDIWLAHVANGRVDGFLERVKSDIGPVGPLEVTTAGAFHYVGVGELATLSDVYMVSLDALTGKVVSSPTLVSQSTGHSFMPRWSRDGRQLAFKSGPSGATWPAVSILTIGTGDERVTRPRPHVYMGPAFDWSPDGRFFVMQANPTTNRRAADGWGLYRIDALTGEWSLIAPNTVPGGIPRFLPPDGRSVAYRQGQNKVVLRDLETGDERTIVDRGAFVRAFALSPDGRSIAFLAARGEENPKGDIHVASIDDGRSRTLAEYHMPVVPSCCTDITWSHDGRYVIFGDDTADTLMNGTTNRQFELWRVPADGGRVEKLGLTADSILTPAASPDGRRLAYSVAQDRSGYWVLENFLPAAELVPARAGRARR